MATMASAKPSRIGPGRRAGAVRPTRPSTYNAASTAITSQIASTTARVKIPHCSTRSAFDRNFIAVANSTNPITTFTSCSHAPDRGSFATALGISASRKKGSAKTQEKTSSPVSGQIQLPREAMTSSVPTNGVVQVNDVNVKVSPIRRIPPVSLPLPRVAPSSRVSSDAGTPIW